MRACLEWRRLELTMLMVGMLLLGLASFLLLAFFVELCDRV
jgi:hypothetical protein